MPSYYTRVTDRELEAFTGALGRDMRYISENGINKLKTPELKAVARSLIREANKRVRALEANGLTDMPAYRHYKNDIKKFTVQNKTHQQIRNITMQAYHFLLSKTSTVAGANEFLNTTTNKWIGKNTTKEQREKIWDTFNRLEKEHPGIFTVEAYTSAELMQDIYTINVILDATDWDVDKAIELLSNDGNLSRLEDEDQEEQDTENIHKYQEAQDELAEFYFRRYE